MNTLDGIINVLKPSGITSHDVVNRIRRIYHTKKVGHTGTLDPDAVGVLPICIGQGTRLAEYLTNDHKTYRVIVRFGSETDTQDATGRVLTTTGPSPLSTADFAAVVEGFIGTYTQIPPVYSAIKIDGKKLYEYARSGIEVEVPARTVMLHDVRILFYNRDLAMLDVFCSKGTYIRTFCQDLGRACGSSAHMQFLIRLASGSWEIRTSVSLNTLEKAAEPKQYITPMHQATAGMPVIVIDDPQTTKRLLNGLSQYVSLPSGVATPTTDEIFPVKAITPQEQLLAVGLYRDAQFYPKKVFKVADDHV